MQEQRITRVLQVDASGRRAGSSSRALSDKLVGALRELHGEVALKRRDLSQGVPFVDEAWIGANFTREESRSGAQRDQLAISDMLVAELAEADILVIGVPIYNFGVPAALKAWIDMVARARKTFRYTADGPVGLLEDKKAYLVIASGGVAVDSEADFATPYMRHALRFLGISDIEVIAADRQNSRGEAAIESARRKIESLRRAA